jgi:hypothetical protein
MATNTIGVAGNIYDLLKMKSPDGSPIDFIINTLMERDPLTPIMPSMPSNNGMSYSGLRATGLPTPYVVDIGGSWKESKSEYEPFEEGLVSIRSAYQAPEDMFQNEDPVVAKKLLEEQRKAHVMAIEQAIMNLILRGSNSTTKGQNKLIGLLERANYQSVDNSYVFDVGGSAILRHALLIKPGISTVCFLHNKYHPTFGIEEKDKTGPNGVRVDGLGTNSDEHRYDICIEYKLTRGLCLRDQTALKLIANIPVASTDNPGSTIVDAAIEASIINATKEGGSQPWVLLVSERTYAKLVKAQNDKTFVYTSADNIWRTELPMISPNIAVAVLDALNLPAASSETELA